MAARVTPAQLRRIQTAAAAQPVRASSPAAARPVAVTSPANLPEMASTGGEMNVPGAAAAFWFGIPFPVRSKSNFRRDDTGAVWDDQTSFEAHIQALARRFRPADWELGPTGAGTLASRPTVIGFLYSRGLIDAGNISKSILDACEGVVFHNDASARHVTSLTDRAATDRFGVVGFALVAPDTTRSQLLRIAADLADSVTAKLPT